MSERNDRLRWQVVTGLLKHFHLERWSERFNPRLVLAGFNFINAGVSITLIAFIALISQEAFIFPSLGATAFLLFYLPLAEASAPRNVLCGHLIGALVGWLSLATFGLLDEPSAMINGVELPRVAAAGLALGTTCFLMVLLRVVHPPAAATSLMVALGTMTSLHQIEVLLAGVVLLLIQAMVINRLAGIPYPVWSKHTPDT
ncbi:hypothetical protein A167_02759 [Alcanivorax sp. S71-1-4]|uniref:HPP family protein n=1 Tax=Alcanivorax sp. S71-1-4 TaxID=1177159 RepID=UPI0013578E20|nr:HPP family protein [Alcanivorax sp. S71-1-4]KAF0807885.1 hypothetical protein A167_02759 [Alcanivorax sp. S71-1-4]